MWEKLYEAIPERLRGWVTKHISLETSTNPEARAYVRLENGRYYMGFHPEFVEQTPVEELTGVWLHEIQHVSRGDCLIPRKAIDNLGIAAMEYAINESLLERGIPLPEPRVDGKHITEQFQLDEPLPHWSTGFRYIEQWLRKRVPTIEISIGNWDDVIQAENTPENRTATVKAILDLPEDLTGGRNVIPGVRPWKPNVLEVSEVAQMAVRLAGTARQGSVPKWNSGWGRPNKTAVALGLPATKGYYPRPKGRVITAFDSSGSMSEYVGMYKDLVHELRAICPTESWVWADRAAVWPIEDEMPNVGGGTQLVPLLEGLHGEEDALLVVFTDGYLADTEEAEKLVRERCWRVVWALTPGGHIPFNGEEAIYLSTKGK